MPYMYIYRSMPVANLLCIKAKIIINIQLFCGLP